MSTREVVIVEGVRTPFAKSGTKLKDVHATVLGKTALTELINKTNLNKSLVDEVIIGNTGTPSDAANISRVVALNSGLPQSVSAATVHRNCASALESISSGYEKIMSGTMNCVLAGGTENMSQTPLIWNKEHLRRLEKLARARTPVAKIKGLLSLLAANISQVKEIATTRPDQPSKMKPRMALLEGLTDPFVGLNMGETAEILAKEFGLSREEQDAFAVNSHKKAVAAAESGRLAEEITPLYIGKDHSTVISEDYGPRKDQSLEKLAKLKPYFDRKFGTVTAGNACPITDGAAMVLLMEKEQALAEGYKPIAKIRGYAFAGLEPERMGLGPVYSTPIALKRAGVSMKDIGLIELNEAFSAQVMACQKAFASDKFAQEKLGLSHAVGEVRDEILNVNGGAVAIGHPVGATGTRLVLTLIKEMQRRDVELGLATLCIGGGQGGAMVLERVN
jgi:acetyl-CoA acyltransferase